MMKKHRIYIRFILVLAFFLLGWWYIGKCFLEEKLISSLEVALQSAEDNEGELHKVIRHYQKYPADSLKYKAACFLIENIPFYFYSEGEQLENYKSYYAWLKKSRGQTAKQVADSVKKVYGPLGEPEKKHDIREVDSAYLCNNIEWAFKVWREQPWGKNVSFETFCEYILPYRIEDETLEYWREMYYEKYNSLLDSLRMSDVLDKEDPIVAAKYLRDTDLAEDLVQDVIYDFWKQRQHLSELSSLKSWLYISVRNRCINYLEHDKVKKKYLQLNGEAEADFFLSQIIEEEVYLALKQAIDILPPKIRTIFYLILERKTNAEIASLLGITEEAVKAYRKRGMKMLRIRLSNFWILALLIF